MEELKLLKISNVICTLENLARAIEIGLEETDTVFAISPTEKNRDVFRALLKLLGKDWKIKHRRKFVDDGIIIWRANRCWIGYKDERDRFKKVELDIVQV